MPRRSPAGLLAASQGDSTQAQRKRRRRIVYIWVENSIKWVCPASVQKGSSRVCVCDHPCTDSSYGKCVYTYPDKDFRLYPGIPRNTDHWDNLYRYRVTVERTINIFKDSFVLDSGKSHRTVTVKADLFLAGIAQLVGVLLADALHKPQYIKSVRKLIV